VKTRLALIAVVLFAGALWSGCTSCTDAYFFSGAFLTLHLPPASDVVAPETVAVCRESTCATATLPDDPSAPIAFSLPEVTATITLDAGNVRLLRINWTVTEAPASGPHDTYDVTVTDAAGNTTGALSGTVTYSGSMPNGPGCGLTLYGALSD
jgi:hypothetical protein